MEVLAIRCCSYEYGEVRAALEKVFEGFSKGNFFGTKVLVKPNLVSPRRAWLSCTNPQVVRAVCEILFDLGASEVVVGDSPAFGTAKSVAVACGLHSALKDLGVKIAGFSKSVPVTLSSGVKVRIAREALCADAVVNVPKFKAHSQLRMTLAVKNLFGCVVGLQKPILHAKLGHAPGLFPRTILEVYELVPVALNVVDAVVAMEGSGPTSGSPKKLNYIFASKNGVLLDSFLYESLGLRPESVPLWQEAVNMRLYGSYTEPFRPLPKVDLKGFRVPEDLSPITFHPLRLAKGLLKRILMRLFPRFR